MWRTVDEKHWDPARVGAEWDRARSELRPRMAAARSAAEARAVLVELLGRLGQSHFEIIGAEAVAEVQPVPAPDGSCRVGDLGFETRAVDGRALVTRVEGGSAAAGAGVRPGWILDRVDQIDVASLVARVGRARPRDRAAPSEAVQRLAFGCAGAPASVHLLGRGDRPEALRLVRAEPTGREVQFGNLPAVRVTYKADRIGGDVGRIAFNIFLDAEVMLADFARDMERFAGTRGVVLDLRGNPGGIIGMAMGMGSWFISERAFLGTMKTRDAAIKMILTPRPRPYAGKLAILVDELSTSTSEFLAGGLQDLGRARVFGARTRGAALPSLIERLPTGDIFQYAIASYVSAGGAPLEGRGVVPDVEAPPTRAALLAGGDPALDAALAWIRSPTAVDKE